MSLVLSELAERNLVKKYLPKKNSPPRIDPVEKLVLFYIKKSALDNEWNDLAQKQNDLEQKQNYLAQEQKELRAQKATLKKQIDIWDAKNEILDNDLNESGCKEQITNALQKPEATIESIVKVLYKGTCANRLPAIGIKAGGFTRRKKRKTRKN